MPTSVYNSILTAVASQVTGLMLAPTSVRKLPRNEEGIDGALPIIAVCPSEEGEDVVPFDTEGHFGVSYKVDVVIIAAGNRDPVTGLDTYLDWRQQIETLFAPSTLPGVASVYETTVKPQAPINRSLVNQDYDYSGLRVVFSSYEKRV